MYIEDYGTEIKYEDVIGFDKEIVKVTPETINLKLKTGYLINVFRHGKMIAQLTFGTKLWVDSIQGTSFVDPITIKDLLLKIQDLNGMVLCN